MSTRKPAASAPVSKGAEKPKAAAAKPAPAKKANAAPAKKAAAKPAKKAAAAPAVKPAAQPPATKKPAAAPAKREAAKTPAVNSPRREAMLARVESVRLEQRAAGHFDCFGRAAQGYCDQGICAYHDECLSISRLLHEV